MVSKEFKFEVRRLIRKWALDGSIVLLAAIVAFGIFQFSVRETGQKMDLYELANFFSIRGPRLPPSDVIIASIDDITVQTLEANPRIWPRIHTAKALEKIVSAGPKVVILDVNFPKEDYDPQANEILEKALAAGPTTIWSGQMAKSDASLLGTKEFRSFTFPSDERFRKVAKMELPMWTLEKFGQRAQIAADTKESADLFDRAPLSKPLVELGKLDIVAPGGQDFINFYGPQDTVRSISLYKILEANEETLRANFKDKVVLFGYQTGALNRGLGNKDEFPVPVSDKDMFGVEIHANIVGNLLDRSWLRRVPLDQQFLLIFLPVFWMSWIAITLSPEKAIPAILGFLTIDALGSYYAFANYQTFIPGLYPIFIAGIIALFLSFAQNYKTFKKQFLEINKALDFKRYKRKG